MNNPKIAIAVFIENAGFGADVAAPIAAQIIKKALKTIDCNTKKWCAIKLKYML